MEESRKESNLKLIGSKLFAAVFFVMLVTVFHRATAFGQPTSLVLGYSGSGISTDLRRVMDLEKIWEKHGLIIKSVYFNSGSVLTQAMIGGNIALSDSGVPEM